MKSISQRESDELVQPTDPLVTPSDVWRKYAVINANIRRGRDWVAHVRLSERLGVVKGPQEYWQYYFEKGRDGPKTIDLAPSIFYRARLSGQHFGFYIDMGGHINYFQEKAFTRELDRRFRDCVPDVDFTCDGDWANDGFSRNIPEVNLGEAEFFLVSPRR